MDYEAYYLPSEFEERRAKGRKAIDRAYQLLQPPLFEYVKDLLPEISDVKR